MMLVIGQKTVEEHSKESNAGFVMCITVYDIYVSYHDGLSSYYCMIKLAPAEAKETNCVQLTMSKFFQKKKAKQIQGITMTNRKTIDGIFDPKEKNITIVWDSPATPTPTPTPTATPSPGGSPAPSPTPTPVTTPARLRTSPAFIRGTGAGPARRSRSSRPFTTTWAAFPPTCTARR